MDFLSSLKIVLDSIFYAYKPLSTRTYAFSEKIRVHLKKKFFQSENVLASVEEWIF